MSNTNYGEVLCQAVDEIVRKRLEGVSYDQTILCTIVDDEKRKEGLYVVSNNGAVKFDAYSTDTNYRKNDNVYVQIPGGDWNQQKTIISKKTTNVEKPFIYKNPFETLVDITGNIIDINKNSDILTTAGLLANGVTESVVLWTYNIKDSAVNQEGEDFAAYTRLGIQAGFKSLLNPFYVDDNAYNVVNGDYGLRLIISAETPNTTTAEATETAAEYVIYLNCSDMNGNPYNFQTFYTQEKVVDISSVGKIKIMQLEFYQTQGSFKSAEGEMSPSTDFLGNQLEPNLFVNDVYISLGYDTGDFEDEEVLVYTLDSTTYSKNVETNYKKVQLRWVHKLEDGTFKSITAEDKMDYKVRWYRFELGHSSADEYSGVYWKNWSTQETYYNAEAGQASSYKILDAEYKALVENNIELGYLNPGYFYTYLTPDIETQREQIKAIILYNGEVYRSNILILENENEVANKATIDAIQALSIVCDDNTYGNYRIYGQNGQLLDQAQARLPRKFVPYFSSVAEGQQPAPTPLVEAEEVEWIIPTKNTMIKVEPTEDSWQEENNDKRLHIIKKSDESFYLPYAINSYYSQNYSDNTIQCKIIKNGITYTAVKELTFGVSGTMGSDCTFVLDFEGNTTALTVGDTETAVQVSARLYDYENKEVDISEREITWGWKVSDNNILINGDSNITKELKLNSSNNISANYNILQATLKEWGDGSLTAYLPIPIRTSTDYAYISGATQVIYDSDGNISNLYANPYILYGTDAMEASASWSIKNGNSGEENYSPSIITDTKDGQYLKPLSFYVENACEKVCVIASVGGTVVWLQPLLIMQNKYPSAMINQWDGNLNVGETDPGTILAPRLVAGKKNDDNTFSGVVMGDWTPTNSDSSLTEGTGLYGYHYGEQSFGFKEDGTAFIGKSGAGRISFDGNSGIIESGAYRVENGVEQKGMRIDLSNGQIDAHTFTLTAGKSKSSISVGQNNTISIDTTADTYPLQIGSYFKVGWDGAVNATNGTFNGIIQADDGYIGGWTISEGALTNDFTTLGADGSITAGNNFSVDASGNVKITGSISGSEISGSSIKSSSINVNDKFVVDANGNLTAKGAYVQGEIIATKGQIGKWYIYTETDDKEQLPTSYILYGGASRYIVLNGGAGGGIAVGATNEGASLIQETGGLFQVNMSGECTMARLTVNGTLSSSISGNLTVGGSLTTDSLKATSITLGSKTLSIKSINIPTYTLSSSYETFSGIASFNAAGYAVFEIRVPVFSFSSNNNSYNIVTG